MSDDTLSPDGEVERGRVVIYEASGNFSDPTDLAAFLLGEVSALEPDQQIELTVWPMTWFQTPIEAGQAAWEKTEELSSGFSALLRRWPVSQEDEE